MEHLNADELDVNEQNPQALGFYFKQGFEVIGRSEVDGMGQPYPLLHMRLRQTSSAQTADTTRNAPHLQKAPAQMAGLNRRQAGTMPTPFLLRPCHD
jgi:hypothetical protein